ncbi:MAG: endonuclease III, partial [Paenisporosarcina sp.]
MLTKAQWEICLSEMERMFPDAHCELVHSNPFELLVATLLSAQCTDVLVNKVTPGLFAKYKSPEDYLSVSVEELQNDIRSIGLFRNKAKNIQALSRILIDNFDGQVPANRDLLTTFPGVG